MTAEQPNLRELLDHIRKTASTPNQLYWQSFLELDPAEQLEVLVRAMLGLSATVEFLMKKIADVDGRTRPVAEIAVFVFLFWRD